MRELGHLLLWAGFLSAAFFSVARLEDSENPWATIPWVAYGASLAAGCVGVTLLRQVRGRADADVSKTEAEYSVLRNSLEQVTAIVVRLREQSERRPEEVVRCIDDECSEPLSEFAEARQSMVKRFGLSTYAEVMTEFASAERYVNRSWSAAADGYVDEVQASLGRACGHLAKAKGLLDDAERLHPSPGG